MYEDRVRSSSTKCFLTLSDDFLIDLTSLQYETFLSTIGQDVQNLSLEIPSHRRVPFYIHRPLVPTFVFIRVNGSKN